MASVADIVIGNTISFRSKAANDNNYYNGVVLGIANSEVAKTYYDIYTYNSGVQSADSSVPEVALQEFLIIKLLEKISDETKYIIVMSKDWILEESLVIRLTDKTASIIVYDVDATNGQDVINLLKANGFKARISSYN